MFFSRLRLFPSYIFLASRNGVMRCRLPLRSRTGFPGCATSAAWSRGIDVVRMFIVGLGGVSA